MAQEEHPGASSSSSSYGPVIPTSGDSKCSRGVVYGPGLVVRSSASLSPNPAIPLLCLCGIKIDRDAAVVTFVSLVAIQLRFTLEAGDASQ